MQATLYRRSDLAHLRLELRHLSGRFVRGPAAYPDLEALRLEFLPRHGDPALTWHLNSNSHFVLLNGWGHPDHCPTLSAPPFDPAWWHDFDAFIDGYLDADPDAELLFDGRRHNFNRGTGAESLFLVEGATFDVLLTKYERNPEARHACLSNYGYACAVCGLDFEAVYGDIGRGFIHVHHLVSPTEIGRQYIIEPVRDLRPVCPNCHAMLHRTDPPMDIEDLRHRLLSLRNVSR